MELNYKKVTKKIDSFSYNDNIFLNYKLAIKKRFITLVIIKG